MTQSKSKFLFSTCIPLLSFCCFWSVIPVVCLSCLFLFCLYVPNRRLCSVFIEHHRKHGMGKSTVIFNRDFNRVLQKLLSRHQLTQNITQNYTKRLSTCSHTLLPTFIEYVLSLLSTFWLLSAHDYHNMCINTLFWVNNMG